MPCRVGGIGPPSFPPEAQAQRIAEGYHYDVPTDVRLDEAGARAKLVNWVANDGNPSEQHVYFRNTSNRPITVMAFGRKIASHAWPQRRSRSVVQV